MKVVYDCNECNDVVNNAVAHDTVLHDVAGLVDVVFGMMFCVVLLIVMCCL
jgi:hypothetical protein